MSDQQPIDVRVTNEAAATGVGVVFGTLGLFALFALTAMLLVILAVVLVPVVFVLAILWVFVRTARLNVQYREFLSDLGWPDPREKGRRFK